MATSWPKERRLIGTKVPRLDGPAKATGRAKYSFDINRPGMLFAQMLRSPHARARVKSIDTEAAEKLPGFRAVHIIAKPGTELYYAGDEVLAVAGDTEDQVRDILRAIKIDWQELPFLVKEDDALKNDLKTAPPIITDMDGKKVEIRDNLRGGAANTKGNVDDAFKKADAVVTGTYGVPTICHQCLESHGLVAEWNDEGGLTVWCSTQAVTGTAQALANFFKLAPGKVKCITHYMGGGFGSKFGPDIQGITASELARKARRPVKLMLDRAEEITVGGNRPSAYGTVRISGMKDGTLTGFDIDCYGTPGVGSSATVNLNALPYVYVIPAYKRKHQVIRLNAGGARAMRAPGHPQNCFLTESALDDLAFKLGIDPLIIRRKNIPQNDPDAEDKLSWAATRHTIYSKELDIAVEMSKWKDKWHPPGEGGKGPIKRGMGMALHTWGGNAQGGNPPPNECTVLIARDGSVTAKTSTQDLGTGQRTVTAIVVAEILGLEPKDIALKFGENELGRSTGSGGSTTCPGQSPASLRAATAARDAFFDKIAPKLGAKKENLSIDRGKVKDSASKKSWDWKEACAKLGMDEIKGEGNWSGDPDTIKANPNVSSVQVGGVQVAEVTVDMETGLVRCTRIVAVQDCGMIINKLCCESQVAGGVIMGVNYALLEDRIMDRKTGRQVNADMEFYKLGGIQDMPRIDVHMHDMPERGVIGIGEPPTISTAAAIGNAVFNALGVRVPFAPFSPANVLAALAKKGGKS
jgi:xanthine dehydrogenase YagR molybdenum-binding subunit